MATLLTKSYQVIGSKTIANTGYGNIILRIYAKYNSQSTANNNTPVARKLVLYLSAGTFYSGGCSYSLTGCGSKSGQNLSYSSGEHTLLSEATANVSHNSDGSSKTTTLTCSYNIYGKSGSFTASFTVPKINRLATVSSATDFNDEGNPTVTFSNPGGFTARPYLNFYDSSGTLVHSISRTSGVTSPYTWNLTDEEREAMRKATNKQSSYKVNVGVDTYSGSTKLGYSSVAKIMTYINANPIYTSDFLETNQKVIDLLGSDSDSIVKNASNVKITINPSGLKEATINSVKITHNGGTVTLTKSPYEYNFAVQADMFEILVTDSRGFTASGTITKDLIDYLNMKIMSYSFNRLSPVDSTVVLNANIQFKVTDIGGYTNAPTVQWKRGEKGEYQTLPSSSYTISDTTLKINNLRLEDVIDYREQDTFYLYVKDLLSEDTQSAVILKGVPPYESGEHDLQVNGDLFLADTNRENKINVRELLEKQQPAAMTARMTDNYTMTNNTDQQVLPVNHIISSTGDKLSITNSGIKIGPGIDYVMVSAQIYFYTNVLTTNDTIGYIRRYRDGSYSTIVTHNERFADNYEHMTLGTRIVAVQEGDVISLSVQNNTAKTTLIQGTYDTGTFLTVQAVSGTPVKIEGSNSDTPNDNTTEKEQKILWSGAWVMHASQTANLSENISEQKRM